MNLFHSCFGCLICGISHSLSYLLLVQEIHFNHHKELFNINEIEQKIKRNELLKQRQEWILLTFKKGITSGVTSMSYIWKMRSIEYHCYKKSYKVLEGLEMFAASKEQMVFSGDLVKSSYENLLVPTAGHCAEILHLHRVLFTGHADIHLESYKA